MYLHLLDYEIWQLPDASNLRQISGQTYRKVFVNFNLIGEDDIKIQSVKGHCRTGSH